MDKTNLSPEEISKKGDEIYFTLLKNKLETAQNGKYVVIEVVSKDYFVDSDLKKALEEAQKKYPDKLFHIVKVGNLQKLSKQKTYAWLF